MGDSIVGGAETNDVSVPYANLLHAVAQTALGTAQYGTGPIQIARGIDMCWKLPDSAGMEPIYRICIFGDESRFSDQIRTCLTNQLAEFDLKVGQEVDLLFGSDESTGRPENLATVGVFFGASPKPKYQSPSAIQDHHPVIPVVSQLVQCSKELPEEVSAFNAIANDGASSDTAIASSILECLGLMPSRRRVFLSYRRTEAREVALQLFDELSARQFDVFLDTHEVRPGAVFQDVLWHQLCDSDVMLMLDTETYFESRWTVEEFGKANLKKAAILRVGFPEVERDKNLSVTESIDLNADGFDDDGLINPANVDRIADGVERLRSKSVAVRQANLIGSYRTAVTQLDGKMEKPGPLRRLLTTFPTGQEITVYPAVGVPTSDLVNKIANDAVSGEFAVLYDSAGVLESWQDHLEWLGFRVENFRWIRAEASAFALKEFAQ